MACGDVSPSPADGTWAGRRTGRSRGGYAASCRLRAVFASRDITRSLNGHPQPHSDHYRSPRPPNPPVEVRLAWISRRPGLFSHLESLFIAARPVGKVGRQSHIPRCFRSEPAPRPVRPPPRHFPRCHTTGYPPHHADLRRTRPAHRLQRRRPAPPAPVARSSDRYTTHPGKRTGSEAPQLHYFPVGLSKRSMVRSLYPGAMGGKCGHFPEKKS